MKNKTESGCPIDEIPIFPHYRFFIKQLEENGITTMEGVIKHLAKNGHRNCISGQTGVGRSTEDDFSTKLFEAIDYFIEHKKGQSILPIAHKIQCTWSEREEGDGDELEIEKSYQLLLSAIKEYMELFKAPPPRKTIFDTTYGQMSVKEVVFNYNPEEIETSVFVYFEICG